MIKGNSNKAVPLKIMGFFKAKNALQLFILSTVNDREEKL